MKYFVPLYKINYDDQKNDYNFVLPKNKDFKIEYNDINKLLFCEKWNLNTRNIFLSQLIDKYFYMFAINIPLNQRDDILGLGDTILENNDLKADIVLSHLNFKDKTIDYPSLVDKYINDNYGYILGTKTSFKQFDLVRTMITTQQSLDKHKWYIPYKFFPLINKKILITKDNIYWENNEIVKFVVEIIADLLTNNRITINILENSKMIELFKNDKSASKTSTFFDNNYISRLYEISVKNNYKIINPLDDNSGVNIFLLHRVSDFKGINFYIDKLKNIYLYHKSESINKTNILKYLKNISPVTYEIPMLENEALLLQDLDKRIPEIIKVSIGNFFHNSQSDIVLLKYADASTGLGIYGFHKNSYQLYVDIALKKISEAIIHFRKLNNPKLKDIFVYMITNKSNERQNQMILQEYILSPYCTLKERKNKAGLFCIEGSNVDIQKRFKQFLREDTEILNDQIIESLEKNKMTIKFYEEAFDKDAFERKGNYLNSKLCFLKYHYKLRFFLIIDKIYENNKLYNRILFPEIISFEWLLPFTEESIMKLYKPSKYSECVSFPGVNRYVSNSLGLDKVYGQFFGLTSTAKYDHTYLCLKDIITNSGKKIIDFLGNFLTGYVEFENATGNKLDSHILAHHKKNNNKLVPIIGSRCITSVDVMITQKYDLKIIDINSVGAPMDTRIMDFYIYIADPLIKPMINQLSEVNNANGVYKKYSIRDPKDLGNTLNSGIKELFFHDFVKEA